MTDDISEKLLTLLDPPGSCLYHYTTLEAAVEPILPSGRIKMNPFSKMRDPHEAKALNPVGAVDPPGSATVESSRRFAAIHQKSNQIKDQVKVLSLVRDDLSPHLESGIFARGFAHPRLWEQYAERHRGICLCFDQAKLTALLTAELAKHGEPEHGEPEHGEVIYRDGTIEPTAFTFALAEIETYSDDEIIDRMIRAGMRELFFTKVMDWAIQELAFDESHATWVGDWHTHTVGGNRPSGTDAESYRQLLCDNELQFERFLALIVTSASGSFADAEIWPWLAGAGGLR